MHPFEYLVKNLSHHAYFLHSFKDGAHKLKEFLKKEFHIDHVQNPDFFHEKYEVLGIDESRRIKELHLSKSFLEGNKKIFIIEASGMTHEAQNSLLKIFEEPHEHSHFFLIMPSADILLPTLRSRLLILEKQENEGSTSEVVKFLKLSQKDKVAFVDDLAKRISDEEATKSDALEFLAQLELTLHKNGVEKNSNALKAILKARDYMNDRSPSIKQLLEYVALMC
ncbi:MAG: polymerase subunit delta [Patescibacteria group bacterium]|nr:polymerase subunit delta [Patescibacteria group bacterium]